MYGVDDEKEELNKLLEQNRNRLADLEAQSEPTEKKLKSARTRTIKQLKEDNTKIESRINGLDDLLAKIGGVITAEECRHLTLQKHNDLVQTELAKYLNAEKRKLIAGMEKLWDKYAVPMTQLEQQRTETLKALNRFLTELNYLEQAQKTIA